MGRPAADVANRWPADVTDDREDFNFSKKEAQTRIAEFNPSKKKERTRIAEFNPSKKKERTRIAEFNP